jgi:hypothetical protein
LRRQRVVKRAEAPEGERPCYRLVHAHCLRSQTGQAAKQRSTSAASSKSPLRLA